VFKKDGCYFSLNNNLLRTYRQIETQHLQEMARKNEAITTTTAPPSDNCYISYAVEVAVVAQNMIPKPILDMSVCSADESDGDVSSRSESPEDEGEKFEKIYQ